MTPPDSPSSDFYDRVGKCCTLLLSQETDKALKIIEDLQREAPERAESFYLLGLAAITIEEYGRALMLIEEAHERDPECFEYSEVLANLHVRVGNLTEGVYFAKLSTTLEPHPRVFNLIPSDLSNFFESLEQTTVPRHFAFGYVRFHQNEFQEAARELERHAIIRPDDSEARRYGALAHLSLGEYEKAIVYAQAAVKCAPEDPNCHYSAGMVSARIGAVQPALYHFGEFFKNDPEYHAMAMAAFAECQALPGVAPYDLAKIETAFNKLMDGVGELPPEASPSDYRKEKIHVGYVVNECWRADTAAILEPLLEHHDRERFEVYLYQQTQGRSGFVQQINNLADYERPFWELDDDTASVIVAGDEIDVLVNMCGADDKNRAALFAMAPSSIQLGYMAPRFGLKNPGITHVLADPMTMEVMENNKAPDQTILQLRPGLWGVKASYLLPDVNDLPAATADHVTFGALCDLGALTEDTVTVIADVLNATPISRLLLGAAGTADAYPGKRLAELFEPHGLADRVAVWDDPGMGERWLPSADYWHEIDMFLVPGAIRAPLRVADALWMGVPVLTIRGDTPESRSATSILASAAKLEWSGDSTQAFLDTAQKLAGDLDALAETRKSLRGEVTRSALFNPVLRVREFEGVLTKLVDERG
ncbi:MAG: tetratricopeptide repeat protein [Rhodospirillaceae bacterium]